MQLCADGMYCCVATLDASCCSNPMVAKFALPDLNERVLTTSLTSASAAPTSSSQAHTPAPSPPPSSSQGSLSIGAKAGIGAGVALGAIAVMAILLLVWRRRRSTPAQEAYYLGAEMEAPAARSGDDMVKYACATEAMSGKRGVGELHGDARPHELAASTYRG